MILMLEDDPARVARFAAVLAALNPVVRLVVWRDAHRMIREVEALLPAAKLVSLDHDLEPEPGHPDPGDGLDVARFLAAQPVVRPVIIHTSNGERGDRMAGTFELARWRTRRVAPLGDDWVEVDWRAIVRRVLRRAVQET